MCQQANPAMPAPCLPLRPCSDIIVIPTVPFMIWTVDNLPAGVDLYGLPSVPLPLQWANGNASAVRLEGEETLAPQSEAAAKDHEQ